MGDQRRCSISLVGLSSLLTIFSVLCLTVFALLSVSTAQANQRLREHAAAAVEGYYAADCEAEAILACLRAGEQPDGVTEENGVYSYTCAISETQTLAVEVTVEGASYQVLRWQAVSAVRWQAEEYLPVWNEEGGG